MLNEVADTLIDLIDVHHLLEALSASALDIDPRALIPLADAHRSRLRATLATVERARVAIGCPPDPGILTRL